MRRDYYRGSQDSLTAHLDDRRCSGPLYRGGSLRGMHHTHSLTAFIQYTLASSFFYLKFLDTEISAQEVYGPINLLYTAKERKYNGII